MSKKHAERVLRPRLITVAVASCFAANAAYANPSGPAVVHGAASFQQSGSLLQINNSPNTIINWQHFSIGAAEVTRFVQQSAASGVLNRVVSQDPSAILGTLQSNGRVFLINPNGILFGATAQVDVAGLVASTLQLSNEDFLAGRMRFTETPGAGMIDNQGRITTADGGSVYLVGSDVVNSGTITAPGGEAVLAAGTSVELVDPSTPNLRVEVTTADNEARNLGTIVADAGRIGIYAGLVTQSGTAQANSAVVTADGHIVLKATKSATLEAGSVTAANGANGGTVAVEAGDTALVAGTVEAKGTAGQGGTVHVLGDKVGLVGDASVDTSGTAGGGTVLAGGDLQGKNASVRNASVTYVGADARINADARDNGDGGKVVVWADDTTRFYGNISAKGGVQGGDGGSSEVSGKKALVYRGLANLTAPKGQTGELLLDPGDVRIDNTNDNWFSNGQFSSSGVFSTDAAQSTITWSTIQSQLSGANTTITTTGSGGTGNISIEDSVPQDLSSANDLTFLAHNDIEINGVISNTGGGAIALYAGWDGASTTSPNVSAGTGSVDVNATISAANDVGITAGGNITVLNATIEANGGQGVGDREAKLLSTGGGIVLNGGTVDVSGGLGGKGSAKLTAAKDIVLQDASVFVTGGDGGEGQGGIGELTLATPGNISVTGSSLDARGGFGTLGAAALVSLDGAGVTVNGVDGFTYISLYGGDGFSGAGGAATLKINANGALALEGADLYAQGGESTGANGGAAQLALAGGSGITVDGGEGSAYGGYATGSGDGGAAAVTLAGGTGPILIDDGYIHAYGGDTGTSLAGNGGAAVISMATPGGITLRNDSEAYAEGGDADSFGTGRGGSADLVLATGGTLEVIGAEVESEGGTGGSGGAGLGTAGLFGTAINLGSADSMFFTDIKASDHLQLTATSDLNVTGGSGSQGSGRATAFGGANTDIVVGGNLNVTGGSGDFANAELGGSPDVNMTVGGAVRLQAGAGAGSSARISAGSSDTIHLTFPLLTTGGYFVNGAENAIYDEATETGFLADGQPAVAGDTFLVLYQGVVAPPPGTDTPPGADQALNQVIKSTNEQLELPQQQFGEAANTGGGEDDDKKKLPICTG